MAKSKIQYFVRPDDFEIFSRNKNGTFSIDAMKRDFPNNLHNEYTEETLRQHGFKPTTPDIIPACNAANNRYHIQIAEEARKRRACGDED